ncbi:MAG: DUF1848 domain-containing protein [Rhodospirillaceae bacterium]|jgi:hypothetical protein|nr:DUF1848 domain-containing protein [Rhodospirillaceae bacterium]MBT4491219.1 DUF1848 domain-containing protein [Rhodospirillaceae bacterium]MBT5194776.1 DUF1848 domain-containing protein [Rhodospirillaceae bacterium]MBT6430765.1 DUF1848 domain-containing protein [Rhodospirillaceae bacterium]MBT7665427.1 DUF1848 domain-containing protein [Rhodospirillaceae bacterium]
MIVSASYRTDIPAFYSGWFAIRLAAGYAMVANPYGGKPYRVALRGDDVDGYVFWSRNMAPFRDNLASLSALSLPFMVQYTATGYPRALEPSVVSAAQATADMVGLARQYGPRAVVWRYDPILFTDMTDAEFHQRNFAALARGLRGVVDEVCVSFAQIYRKSRRNLDLAARRDGFTWRDPDGVEKQALLGSLQNIAADHRMKLTVCSQPEIGGTAAHCIDAERLSDLAGHAISARVKGNRDGCLCAESRDIGAYDSCPHGCAYCYAVRNRDKALGSYRDHDQNSERLA